ncbi:cytochrome C biogenesis protein CcmA [Arsukibacterium sp. MJ3]|uniref:cytochrome c biogenesis heme-transporting ATPase CcmA n=1 Tax=Arsukibacterium sp. MJ3 TaxID=1632859 RepID=UPI000626F7F1|nr:cytochrome c biogenesis heme-transporting ATPase CcmA [Arsukibacterium sp. MJ3]KKO47871.1 cytochrome C biogenesis protein CcmA [Arsukibacterium sp. MJ3]
MNKTPPSPASPNGPLLQGTDLSCIRQDRLLFADLSLQLYPGQLLHVMGKNGAGKSSLLRILAGLAQPDDGQLYYQAKLLQHSLPVYCGNLCYIGHHSGIHEQLTALENLAFWRAASGLKLADDWAVLAQLGLAGLEDVPCRMLSAGQQRRVSLARLWLTPAQIWILDEPFTALDQSAIALLQQQMLHHLSNNGAIILTTHQRLTLHFPALVQLEIAYRW